MALVGIFIFLYICVLAIISKDLFGGMVFVQKKSVRVKNGIKMAFLSESVVIVESGPVIIVASPVLKMENFPLSFFCLRAVS